MAGSREHRLRSYLNYPGARQCNAVEGQVSSLNRRHQFCHVEDLQTLNAFPMLFLRLLFA